MYTSYLQAALCETWFLFSNFGLHPEEQLNQHLELSGMLWMFVIRHLLLVIISNLCLIWNLLIVCFKLRSAWKGPHLVLRFHTWWTATSAEANPRQHHIRLKYEWSAFREWLQLRLLHLKSLRQIIRDRTQKAENTRKNKELCTKRRQVQRLKGIRRQKRAKSAHHLKKKQT